MTTSTLTSTDQEVIAHAVKIVENGWTRGVNARDLNGRQVDHTSPTAARFCAIGAVARAEHDLGPTKDTYQGARIMVAFKKRHRYSLSLFNDHASHKNQVIMAPKALLP